MADMWMIWGRGRGRCSTASRGARLNLYEVRVGSSGGQREFVPVLARAAVAVGVDGLFIESHEDPDNAPSDGPNMVPLDDMPQILQKLIQIDSARRIPTS